MKSLLKFFGGALVGAAIGAGTALLLAPKPGEELRGEIRHRYDDAAQTVRARTGETRAKIEVKVDEARKEIAGRKDAVLEAARRLRAPKGIEMGEPVLS